MLHMASPRGTVSGSSSEDNTQQNTIIETRKRKRMLSNRESARRSRMRKQKHIDDLTAQMTNLRAENNLLLNNISFATHLYLNTESENSVFRAQISELNHRLKALIGIINCVSSNSFEIEGYGVDDYDMIGEVDDVLGPWSLFHANQPIMASSDVFM